MGWEIFCEREKVYKSNGIKIAICVKLIFGLSKGQIHNDTGWRDTISCGSLGTAKSEGSVPLRKPAKPPAFFKKFRVYPNLDFGLKSTPFGKILQPKSSGRKSQVFGKTRRRLPNLPSTPTSLQYRLTFNVDDYE